MEKFFEYLLDLQLVCIRDSFDFCAKNVKMQHAVENCTCNHDLDADYDNMKQLKITTDPALVINGQLYKGYITLEGIMPYLVQQQSVKRHRTTGILLSVISFVFLTIIVVIACYVRRRFGSLSKNLIVYEQFSARNDSITHQTIDSVSC